MTLVIYKEGNSRRFGRIRSIISINNELRIKIQRVYIYNELPNHFYSNARSNTQEWQLWLVDQYLKKGSIIINLNEIVKKTDITIIRNTCNTNGLYIKEILYKNNGHWKLRDVNLDYMHPSEYSVLSPPPSQYKRVLKLFVDIYYDDFGTYQNIYYALGGFVPFGRNFNDFIQPFISDMKQLEQGIVMNVMGEDCWVVAGLGSVTADLPQGNDLTGIKRHGAIKGCRTCLVAKENATDMNLDIANISRYHHITNIQFEEMFATPTLMQQNEIAKEYGLRNSLLALNQL
ncbi:hypothetical protein RhiirA5_386169 [Rhizophagus irregularis]|uniref:Uncharacterized protein n=2 Tax=Rhizophagus irregularis TaxID=588596 RepID=A0A2N0NKU6_9GLOM|nr:hypothetical protein RhiirA5_386169 [Rhizophagus irregularis]